MVAPGFISKYWTKFKRFAKDNHSSFFTQSIGDKEKKIIGVLNVMKLFSLSLMLHSNNNNIFVPGSLIFRSKARALPSGTPFSFRLV
jgi:hypothetical protein